MDLRPNSRESAPVIVEGLFSYQLGGSERVGADVALECARRGYRVICFAFYGSDGPIRLELERAGIRCFDLNYLSRPRFIRRFTYQATLVRFLRQQNAYAIHIHHSTSLILGVLAARIAGAKSIVMTEHSLLELQTMPKYQRQSRRYCRFANAISVVHPSQESFFLSVLKVPREKLHYVPNGVRISQPSVARRVALRTALGATEDTFVWMFAGRLATVKGLPDLIHAFAIARARNNPQFRLVLIGDGTERAALEHLCQSLSLGEAVSFLGFRSDVPALLEAADGFVMSSLSEGVPMVLLEAMAARIPCIATAVGGIPELLGDGAGHLVPASNPNRLAEAMLALAGEPEERKRLSQVAFSKVAATNDLDKVVDRYLELFGLPAKWPMASPASDARMN